MGAENVGAAESGVQTHWDNVYAHRSADQLSWYQHEPSLSLGLIREAAPCYEARIIDVGGGNSVLVDRLLGLGYSALTVLDISSAALEQSQTRLGASRHRVCWKVADVTQTRQLGSFAVWHDRAVFHFLTGESDRDRYVELAAQSVIANGHLIIATFATSGPERCSGLPVCRYEAESLAGVFARGFRLVRSVRETHSTPWGAPQHFVYCVLQRR